MPGLIGIVWHNKVDELLLGRMTRSIKHEEWHRVDKYSDSLFSAARVSLGIFNPEPQPIFNEDKTLCIFMYGKIYDYEKKVNELKNRGHQFTVGNDAEFCLHSYEEYGRDFVKELNGSFVLAIYDVKQRKIIVANDRYGFRPLYYAISGGKILFASEVKAILEDNAFKKELDDRTIADFFAFGEILGNKTFFNGVETLPPASVLTYDGEGISIEQYWDFRYQPDYSLSEDDIVEQLVQTLKKAVKIRMMDDNLRYDLSLSGGLDSRVVLAAIDKSERHRVTAVTFGVPGCDEIKVAQMVAKKAGVSHLIMELDADELVRYAEEVVYLSDGMDTITVSFIPYARNRAREQVDVTFGGLGLDVLLAGLYLNRQILNARTTEDLVATHLSRRLFSHTAMSRLFEASYHRRIEELAANSMRQAIGQIKGEHPVDRSDCFSLRNHIRRFTILGSVISRNKLEEASPTFDNEFIDLLSKIPLHLRFNHRIYRKFLMKLAPELAAIPYQRTMVHADAPLIAWRMGETYQGGKERIKKGIWRLAGGRIYLPNRRSYVNLDEWLRLNEKWRGFVRGLLLGDKACSRGYFNKDYIETMIQEHESGKVDHSQRLAYLATFELFLKMFADR